MNINQEIERVFQQRDDIPLFYIESGSRLWGMASPDSDYDVRGFHLPSKATFYDYKSSRNLIEIMEGDFDFVSYSVDKMFGLLAKSNPTTLEWVRAHIEYLNHFPEWHHFRQGLLHHIEYSALYHHYLSLAKGHYLLLVKENTNTVTYKKVFYCIRGLLSAEIALQKQLPKLFISSLFQQIDSSDILRQWAENYLDIKKQKNEKEQLPIAEKIEITRLLNERIEQLILRQNQLIKIPKQRIALEQYLTDYSYRLKTHFYG